MTYAEFQILLYQIEKAFADLKRRGLISKD